MIKLDGELIPKPDPPTQLLRIANPTEILRPPAADTINYGFLHSTDTQKALFLTPSFALNNKTLLSKTPPLFADAFRLVNSKAVFPNIAEGRINMSKLSPVMTDGIPRQHTQPVRRMAHLVQQLMEIDHWGHAYIAKKFPIFRPEQWDLIQSATPSEIS